LIAALLMVAALPASAQAGEPPNGIRGLLPLPETFAPANCEAFTAADVPLYATADDAAHGRRPVGHVTAVKQRVAKGPNDCEGPEVQLRWADGTVSDEWPTLESGYEARAAIVLAQRGDALQIATNRAPAWVHRPGLKDYLPVGGTLLRDKLLDVRTDLRPLARTSPGGTQRARLQFKPQSASFVQAKVVDGQPWLQLAVRASEPCGGDEDARSTVVWVPFYGAQRRPTVWFFSRGC
jgi:hypothetical protein